MNAHLSGVQVRRLSVPGTTSGTDRAVLGARTDASHRCMRRHRRHRHRRSDGADPQVVVIERRDRAPADISVSSRRLLTLSCHATTATSSSSSSTIASARRWKVVLGTSFSQATARVVIHVSTSSSYGCPAEQENPARRLASPAVESNGRRITRPRRPDATGAPAPPESRGAVHPAPARSDQLPDRTQGEPTRWWRHRTVLRYPRPRARPPTPSVPQTEPEWATTDLPHHRRRRPDRPRRRPGQRKIRSEGQVATWRVPTRSTWPTG